MSLSISTGDVIVGNVSIDLYRGRCDRVWRRRSLLGTLWHGIGRYISTGDGMVGYGVVDPYWGRC